MADRRNEFKLGAVLIVVFLLFFIILLWLPQTIVGGPSRLIRIRFPQSMPLPTLAVGSKVLVAGRPAGHVSAVALEEMPIRDEKDPAKDLYLVVTAKLDESIALRRDCRIRAVGEVLGGAGSLVVDVGSERELAKLDGVLEGAAPGGFGAYLESLGKELDGSNPRSLMGQIKTQLDPDVSSSMLAKLHHTMDDLNSISNSLAVQLNAEQKRSMLAKLHQTMDAINATTATLRDQMKPDQPAAALGKVHAALDSLNTGLRTTVAMLEENRKPLNETLRHVRSTAEKLDARIAESIAEQIDERNEAGLMAKMHRAMDDLNKSLSNIREVSETTRDVVVLNKDNLNKLLINFKQTSDHLNSAAKYVLRHPWRLFKAPDDMETRQQAIFDAARNFTEAATRLDDAAAQLKALHELYDGRIPPDNDDLQRIQADLQNTFKKFNEAEAALWKQLDVR
ncbi:MAG: hypothetical protein L6Q92_13320 [Phycisphaerae bacterium]|nr:hypothetical protein [Phycisphaerae bacterium]